MKSYKSLIFFALTTMILLTQASFAGSRDREAISEDDVAVVLELPPDGYTNEEINAKLTQIMNAIPKIPNRYSNDEIDDKIDKG